MEFAKYSHIADSSQIIRPQDLAVGITLNVFGRPFFLFDCDKFTQEFYDRAFGKTFTAIPIDHLFKPQETLQRVRFVLIILMNVSRVLLEQTVKNLETRKDSRRCSTMKEKFSDSQEL